MSEIGYGPGHDRSMHANADVTDDTHPRSLARRRNSPTSNPRNSLTFHEQREQQRRERRRGNQEQRTSPLAKWSTCSLLSVSVYVGSLRTPQSPRNVCGQDSTLVQNQQTRNRSTAQRAQDAGDQRADRQSCYVAGPARGDLGEHTDLSTKGADVAEAAEAVCRDQLRAIGHLGVRELVDERGESEVLVLQRMLVSRLSLVYRIIMRSLTATTLRPIRRATWRMSRLGTPRRKAIG
jgi:hypothetical protein